MAFAKRHVTYNREGVTVYVKCELCLINLTLNADILTLVFNALSKQAIFVLVSSSFLVRSCTDIILSLDDKGYMSQRMRSGLCSRFGGCETSAYAEKQNICQ